MCAFDTVQREAKDSDLLAIFSPPSVKLCINAMANASGEFRVLSEILQRKVPIEYQFTRKI